MDTKTMIKSEVSLALSNDIWVESLAIDQLKRASMLEDMTLSVAMPDIHPGKGFPVGAVFLTRHGRIYPHLIGNDIGCGMSLWQTDCLVQKLKKDKMVQKLSKLRGLLSSDYNFLENKYGEIVNRFSGALGSLGGGNHFGEFQRIRRVFEPHVLSKKGIDPSFIFLMTHTGSRGFGDWIFRKFTKMTGKLGLSYKVRLGQDFFAFHDQALLWAKANREAFSRRMIRCIGAKGRLLVDCPHNYIERISKGSEEWFVHRKGAVSSQLPLVLVAGTRGSYSYLLRPLNSKLEFGFSLAHGAGRKWMRQSVKGRLSKNFRLSQLLVTTLGSRVLCDDKNLLWEEAPQAYKDIDKVISVLVKAKLVKVVAQLEPMVTYKKWGGE